MLGASLALRSCWPTCFSRRYEKRDHTGLFLVLWILIPLPIVYYVQLPVKYLLPCMPAVILLCFRLMEGFSARVARAAAIALIVASTGYSLLILHSDAEFAVSAGTPCIV